MTWDIIFLIIADEQIIINNSYTAFYKSFNASGFVKIVQLLISRCHSLTATHLAHWRAISPQVYE